jgi:hypothetical protein
MVGVGAPEGRLGHSVADATNADARPAAESDLLLLDPAPNGSSWAYSLVPEPGCLAEEMDLLPAWVNADSPDVGLAMLGVRDGILACRQQHVMLSCLA